MRALTMLAAAALGSMAAPAIAAPTLYGISLVGTEFRADPGRESLLLSGKRDYSGTFTFDPVTNQLIDIDAEFTGPGPGRSFTETAVSLFNAAQPCDLQCFVGSLESGSFFYRYTNGSGSLTFGAPLSGTAVVSSPSAGAGFAAVYGVIRFNGAIPEPGTWALMLIGFGAIGTAMRRQKWAPSVAA